MKRILFILVLVAFSSCAGTGVKRVVIDESKKEPNWVSDERLSWEDDGKVFFKAHQTVRGDQRLNGCYAIASHDNREALIRRQVESMSGQTNEAQADISENAELILGKVRSGEWSGKLYGFKDEGYFFQRVQIRDELAKNVTERIECYTLSSISTADYEKSRQEILNKVAHIDQRIKDAINQKEADFFSKDSVKSEPIQQAEPEVKQEAIQQPVSQAKPASVPTQLPAEVKAPAAPTVQSPAAPAAEPVTQAAPIPAEAAKEVAKVADKALDKVLPTNPLASMVQ